ncbi:MAG: hypothetical protein KF799_05830 [Bdellovibrionales bacterium]|nr:hypothetical protein [Bdellovibrionales bacterium]
MILADLHVHSRYSDGHLTIAELVDFYGQRGFGCIAITDHICERNTFLGLAAKYLKYTLTPESFPAYLAEIHREAERAWERYRMVVIPGFELSKNSFAHHRNAHILGIGISEFVGAEADVVTLARAIRAQGALAVAAHPVPTGRAELQTLHLWDHREELKKEFDAWEVASGPELFGPVMNSGLPMIATSDLHHPRQIQAWKTVLNCEKKPEAILDAVREQKLEFYFYAETSPALGYRPRAAY